MTESAPHSAFDESRRSFLRSSAHWALGAAVSPYLVGCSTAKPAARFGTVVGPGKRIQGDKSITFFVLADLDAETKPVQNFPIPFFGHGFVENPLNGRHAAIFEKRGKGACEVDMTSGKILRVIETAADHHFYGHGAYSPDGAQLYCTESILSKNYQGILAVRDAETMKVVGQVETHGMRPHDCRLIDDGKVMVVTNAGGPIGSADRPNCAYVELASNKLLDKVEFQAQEISAGHLEIAANGDLICVSAPRDGMEKSSAASPGAFSFRRKGSGNRFTTMVEPADVTAKMIGETLSIAIHEPTRTAAATNPAGNLITFWDLAKGSFRGQLALEKPRGAALTKDGSQFVFTQGTKVSNILRVDPTTLKEIPGSRLADVGIGGSHLFGYEPR